MIDVAHIYAEISNAPGIVGVRHAFTSYLFLPDPTVVDVVLAGYVGNHMRGDPVWLDVIGAPSRGKTEVISALADMPDVHMLSTLTAQTFASGVKRDRSASLLYRLEDRGKRVIVLKDLTTVLTMHRDARDAVFAALREIYDGQFTKEFGTGESIEWSGKLGLLAGVTPVIDRHHSAIAQLGDRFLSLRLPEVDRSAMSRRSIASWGDGGTERKALRVVVRAFLETVEVRTDAAPSGAVASEVVAIADVLTHARTAVYRDGYSHEIDDMPELEAPARVAKQLVSLELGLEALGHDEGSAMALVRRVGVDSIPPARVATLRALVAGESEATTTKIATDLGMPSTTTRRTLEDLAALRLVIRCSQGAGKADMWTISDDGLAKWIEAGL